MRILDSMDFNPYAFVSPKTPQEYSALLDEALRLVKQLHEQFDDIDKWLYENVKPLE